MMAIGILIALQFPPVLNSPMAALTFAILTTLVLGVTATVTADSLAPLPLYALLLVIRQQQQQQQITMLLYFEIIISSFSGNTYHAAHLLANIRDFGCTYDHGRDHTLYNLQGITKSLCGT